MPRDQLRVVLDALIALPDPLGLLKRVLCLSIAVPARLQGEGECGKRAISIGLQFVGNKQNLQTVFLGVVE